MNPHGHPATLKPHPENSFAAKHAVYSERLREPRAREIAEAIMAAPHTTGLDEVLAVEVGGSKR